MHRSTFVLSPPTLYSLSQRWISHNQSWTRSSSEDLTYWLGGRVSTRTVVSLNIYVSEFDLTNSFAVHGYFKESPFCDPMSKNYTQFAQAFDNPQLFAQCANRQELERILRERPGLEHMIVGEPQATTNPSEGPDTGVWVIRKQDRKRTQSRGCLLYTSPSPRDGLLSRMPSSA